MCGDHAYICNEIILYRLIKTGNAVFQKRVQQTSVIDDRVSPVRRISETAIGKNRFNRRRILFYPSMIPSAAFIRKLISSVKLNGFTRFYNVSNLFLKVKIRLHNVLFKILIGSEAAYHHGIAYCMKHGKILRMSVCFSTSVHCLELNGFSAVDTDSVFIVFIVFLRLERPIKRTVDVPLMTESTVAIGIFPLLTVKYEVRKIFLYFFRVLTHRRELFKIFDIHVFTSEVQQLIQ